MTTATQQPQQKGSLFGALHALGDEILTEKQAAARTKQADTPTPDDPGGYQGATTHPTKSVDNRGQEASEGARSSENVSDVKADQGTPAVDNTPDNTDGRQDDAQLNIGTHQSATGEDASVEDDYKAGKEDPGTSHPAATDNDSLDGHKYASSTVGELKGVSDNLANSILADLANGYGNQLTKEALDAAQAATGGNLNPSAAGDNAPAQPRTQGAGAAPAAGATPAPAEKQAGADGAPPAQPNGAAAPTELNEMIEKAAAAVKAGKSNGSPAEGNADLQAGYELATVLGIEKKAAQQGVADCLDSTIREARFDADLFGSYYRQIEKRAMEGATGGDGEDHNQPGDDSSGASPAEGTGGETPGGDGGDGGGNGAPEGGGDPIGEMLGGGGGLGDALGGGGDPGGLMPPPEGGLGGGEEAALMQLVAALDELGIPIEELAQAGPPAPEPAMAGGAEMGGGMPPMSEGMKLASVAKAFRRSGKYQFKEASDGSPERQLRDKMKSHLTELVNYSA